MHYRRHYHSNWPELAIFSEDSFYQGCSKQLVQINDKKVKMQIHNPTSSNYCSNRLASYEKLA
jgi:hypothetical protein